MTKLPANPLSTSKNYYVRQICRGHRPTLARACLRPWLHADREFNKDKFNVVIKLTQKVTTLILMKKRGSFVQWMKIKIEDKSQYVK